MTENGVLNEIFDRSIDHCTQSTLFINTFTSRILASSKFMRPVAQFTKTRLNETADEWRLMDQRIFTSGSRQLMAAALTFIVTQRWGWLPENRRIHGKAKAAKLREPTSKTEPKDRYPIAKLDCNTRFTSPGHKSPIPNISRKTCLQELP